MTESEEKQLELLCADVPYMFVLNNLNEIVYVVNDTQITTSITEEEYKQALDSFVARQYQFKSLYEIVNDHDAYSLSTNQHKRLCINCLAKPNSKLIHNMCIHEFIAFLERLFQVRNIISF